MLIEEFDGAFWDDPDVRRLSWLAKLLYLWTFTNARYIETHDYRVKMLEIAKATGIDERMLADLFVETKVAGLVVYKGGCVQLQRVFLDRTVL